jgi:hypothetical protein
MAPAAGYSAIPGPAIFGSRLLIEIEAWQGNLYVGLATELTPQAYRFQGGLNFVRGFDIDGRVVSPDRHSAKTIRLRLSPFARDVRFGPDDFDEVGQLHAHPARPHKPDFSGTLLVPEDALPTVATCLSSVWRYIHVWTFDEEAERASVSAYSFASAVHESPSASAPGE